MTFGPLVRRNACVNCVELAAVPRKYHPDLSGVMDDRTDVGQGCDRLVAAWSLRDGGWSITGMTRDGCCLLTRS